MSLTPLLRLCATASVYAAQLTSKKWGAKNLQTDVIEKRQRKLTEYLRVRDACTVCRMLAVTALRLRRAEYLGHQSHVPGSVRGAAHVPHRRTAHERATFLNVARVRRHERDGVVCSRGVPTSLRLNACSLGAREARPVLVACCASCHGGMLCLLPQERAVR